MFGRRSRTHQNTSSTTPSSNMLGTSHNHHSSSTPHPTTVSPTSKPSLMSRIKGSTQRSTPAHTATTSTHQKTPSRLSRRRARKVHANNHNQPVTTVTTITTTADAETPVHHHTQQPQQQQYGRKASVGEKFSGAMLKLKGGVSGNVGEKVAGERMMKGGQARRHY